MASQFLTTSRLNNIINMIMLGRQSGILRVIRGQGTTREVGQIQFLDGKAVSALLGQVTGANALTVLQNWGECIYAFDEQPLNEAHDAESRYQPGAFPNESNPFSSESQTSPGLSSSSWPTYGYLNSQPNPSPLPSAAPSSSPFANSYPYSNSQPGYMPAYSGTNGSNGYNDGFPNYDGNYGAPQAPSGLGQMPDYQSDYQPGYQNRPRPTPTNQSLDSSGFESLNPRVLVLTPWRTSLSEHVDQLPLDRRERMVLLLVDGRRNLNDLARLTRRTEREVLRVLEHLSGLGLIQFS